MTANRGQNRGRGGGWFSSHLVTQLWSKKREFISGQETFPEGPIGAISRVVLQGPVKRMTGSEKDTSCLKQTPGGPGTKRQVQPEKWRPHHRYFNRRVKAGPSQRPQRFSGDYMPTSDTFAKFWTSKCPIISVPKDTQLSLSLEPSQEGRKP